MTDLIMMKETIVTFGLWWGVVF